MRAELTPAGRRNGRPPKPEGITCPRCTATYATRGELGAHLTYEHHQGETQAYVEATEAATGLKLTEGGRCRACHRVEGEPHTPSCSYARKLGLPTDTSKNTSTTVAPYRIAFATWRRDYFAAVMAAHDGNAEAAARAAGLHVTHLRQMLRRLALPRVDGRATVRRRCRACRRNGHNARTCPRRRS